MDKQCNLIKKLRPNTTYTDSYIIVIFILPPRWDNTEYLHVLIINHKYKSGKELDELYMFGSQSKHLISEFGNMI